MARIEGGAYSARCRELAIRRTDAFRLDVEISGTGRGLRPADQNAGQFHRFVARQQAALIHGAEPEIRCANALARRQNSAEGGKRDQQRRRRSSILSLYYESYASESAEHRDAQGQWLRWFEGSLK